MCVRCSTQPTYPLTLDNSGDVETKKAQTSWTLGSGVNNQQIGNTWTAGDNIVSLSMSGDLNVFDKRVGDKPARVLYVRLSAFRLSPCAFALPTASMLTGSAKGDHLCGQSAFLRLNVHHWHGRWARARPHDRVRVRRRGGARDPRRRPQRVPHGHGSLCWLR